MPTIDNLVIEIESSTSQASGGIDSLCASLRELRSAASNFRNLNVVASALDKIKQSMTGFDGTAATSLNLMTDALNKMSALNGVKISTSIASQITAITQATRGMDGVDWSSIKTMTSGLAELQNVQKSSGLSSTVSAMRKLPAAVEGVNSLKPEVLATFTQRVNELRTAIVPLADEMRAVTAGFSALPANIQRAIRANQKLTASTNTTRRSLGDMLKKVVSLSAAYYGFRKVFSFAMDAFEASNNFIEALNLAEVAMGNGAKAAVEYAQKVEDLIGIDVSEWMTNLGTFNQQLQGFGIDSATANRMSQQLTQLGYDIQSVFNVKDIGSVMGKLSSGISGQIKGMREYGVELSVAAMQEYALSKGIETSWNQMSQAQKVALRYSKIMESTTNIQHDLARTIITPANSLRILSNQWGVAQRYMGQIVSVIAAQVIPVFQALVRIIGQAAKAIAAFFGFTLPDIGAIGSGLDTAAGGADDLDDALKGAGGSAKKVSDEVKGLLASWDEINIIQQQNDSSPRGGGGGGAAALEDIGDLWGLGDYTYDFLDGIQSKVDGIIATIKGFIPEILSAIAAIAAYGLASKLLNIADSLGVSKDILMGMKNIVAGLALTIVGTTLTWRGIDKIVNGEGFTVANVLETIAGNVANVFGFMLIGRGISKLAGLGGVHAFAFGIGMSLAIEGIALAFSMEKNMVENGVNAKNVMWAIAGSIAGGIGATIAAVSLGAAFPIALTLGAIVSIAVGIGVVSLYQSQTYSQLAADAFAASGKGGFSPDEVISAIQTEFSERTKGAQLVIDSMSGVETYQSAISSAAESIQQLNDVVFGDEAPTAEDIASLKDAWAGFDESLSNLNEASFNTMFTALNQIIESEYTYLQGRAQDYQKELLMMQQGLTAREAERAMERNDILDRMYAGTATDEDMARYRQLAMLDIDMGKTEDQRRWDEIKNGGFLIDFSDAENSLEAAKAYVSDVAGIYQSVVDTNEAGYTALAESQEQIRYELGRELKYGIIDQGYYDNQIALLDGILADYRTYTDEEIKATTSELSVIYGALLQQLFENPAIADMDVVGLRSYMAEQVKPLLDAMFETGLLSDSELQSYSGFYNDLMTKIWSIQDEAFAPQGTVLGALFPGAYTKEGGYNDQLQQWYAENVPKMPEIDTENYTASQQTILEDTNTWMTESIGPALQTEMPAIGTTEYFGPSLSDELTNMQTWNTDMTSETQITAYAPDMSSITNSQNAMLSQTALWRSNMLSLMNLGGVGGGTSARLGGMIRTNTGATNYSAAIAAIPTINMYASGGMPKEGELFIANEQGPELVGRIGGSSAVANDEQIVEGIAAGVASANREQNAYYQRMIALLEQLNAKSNEVVLRPSPQLGKVVQRSTEMQARARG